MGYPVAEFAEKLLKRLDEIAFQEDSPIYEGDKETDCFVRLSEVIAAITELLKEELFKLLMENETLTDELKEERKKSEALLKKASDLKEEIIKIYNVHL